MGRGNGDEVYPSIARPWEKWYPADILGSSLPRFTMFGYLWEMNRDHLRNPALEYFGREMTFGELFDGIDRTTAAFWHAGIRKDDVVLICSVTTPETIVALYALNRIGAIANMVDPRTSAEGIRQYAAESGATMILTIDAALPKIGRAVADTPVSQVVVVSPADSLPPVKKVAFKVSNVLRRSAAKLFDGCVRWRDFVSAGGGVIPDYPEYEPDRCAVVVHTGGTTGAPKAAMLSNDSINAAAYQCIAAGFDFQRDQTWLNIMPPFIAYGVGNGLHLPLVVGMKTILIPSFDPDKFDELLIRHRPNHMVGVPSHYGNIIGSKRLSKADLSFVIAPTVGGDAMDVDLEQRVNAFLRSHGCRYDVTKGYGMTEVCAAVSVCISNECNRVGSVGIPLPHTLITIFDPETGEELPCGRSGEICSSGPNTMLGYWDNPEATSEILKTHADGRVWVHSGDIGHMDEDGFLYVEGRIKRMVVRHDGFKVFPSSVERVISRHPRVIACCVVGVPDEDHTQGMLPCAFVVAEAGADFDQLRDEISMLCSQDLPEYAQPVRYEPIDRLPLTLIGKVDYRALEQIAIGRQPS